jgi:hypothetical protein
MDPLASISTARFRGTSEAGWRLRDLADDALVVHYDKVGGAKLG